MKGIAALATGAVAVSLIAVPAGAKELHSAKICGRHKCTKIIEKGDLRAFVSATSRSDEPPSGPFYTVRLTVVDDVGDKGSWTMDYSPSANLIRTTSEHGWAWYGLREDPRSSELGGLLRKLEPFPAHAFEAAIGMPPGTFTAADLAALPDPPAPAAPAPAPRPDPGGIGWLLPLMMLVGACAVIVGGLAATRRRATPT